jgi:hypothetical protein
MGRLPLVPRFPTCDSKELAGYPDERQQSLLIALPAPQHLPRRVPMTLCLRAGAIVLAVSSLFLLHARLVDAQLEGIPYSWSGRLVVNGDDDPWQLGARGMEFDVEVSIPANALDDFDQSVALAGFEAHHVRFRLEGQEIAYLPSGTLSFTDDFANSIDIMTFHGDFERLGAMIEIGSAVAMPCDTLRFMRDSELPPLFGSTINVDRAACCGGTYSAVVDRDASVIIPHAADN